MPISIVVGGQFGSEGKGKVAHYLAKEKNAAVAVRCGGTNSGHTVIDENGAAQVFRQLPTAAILPDVKLALCAGSYIEVDVLTEEIGRAKLEDRRLSIDPYAVIITPVHKQSESSSGLVEGIGSTGSGTGAAVVARIQRGDDVVFAKDAPELGKYIADVNTDLRARLNKKQRVILEGTQGFGLSPLHSKLNPYVTSRDTTAASFLSEVGLSPFDVDEVAMVIRTFPIRVGGNSGPLPNEISWEILTNEGDFKEPICERTSVTKHVRRIARFDPLIVRRAIEANKSNTLVLNHIDYLPKTLRNQESQLNTYITEMETSIGTNIDFLGLGPSQADMRRLK
jgi:adenylosuccinate synthase